MQFPNDQLLKLGGCLSFPGVDTGLDKQILGVDARLFEQQAQAIVLRRQGGLLHRPRRGANGRSCTKRLIRRQHGRVRHNPQRARSNHLLQFSDHLIDTQRFAKKSAVRWPVSFRWLYLTGNQNDLDGRPAVMHGVGQP